MTTIRFAVLLAALLAFAGAAAAQDETKTNESAERPDDAAWVEDCPPDMMCAAGGEPKGDAPADDGRVYKDPACENCRGGDAPADDGSTCMDGAQANETCRDDVMYFGGGPADSGPADAQSHSNLPEGEAAKAVGAVGVAGALAAMGVVAAVAAARRR